MVDNGFGQHTACIADSLSMMWVEQKQPSLI